MRTRGSLRGRLIRALTLICSAALAAGCASIPAPVEPFRIAGGDGAIAGEIRNAGESRCLALVIVGGSSARTRADLEEAVGLFLDPATSVVLTDRRGTGLSGGELTVPDTANTAWLVPQLGADVAEVARYLKRRGFRKVALIGTSMGGWVNSAAAAEAGGAIDAVVSVNGGGSTVGVSDEFDRLVSEGASIEAAAARAREYRGVAGYDPRGDLARMSQPALWVFGARDRSNPTVLDAATVAGFAAQGKPFRTIILPNTDHELIDSATNAFDASWIAPVKQFLREAGPACG